MPLRVGGMVWVCLALRVLLVRRSVQRPLVGFVAFLKGLSFAVLISRVRPQDEDSELTAYRALGLGLRV